VFGVFVQERDDVLQVCEAMTRDPDERVRRDAARLARTLSAIIPVLHPPAHESPEGDEFRRGCRSVST
jgi:capsular polysaccharide biosynthesis protein